MRRVPRVCSASAATLSARLAHTAITATASNKCVRGTGLYAEQSAQQSRHRAHHGDPKIGNQSPKESGEAGHEEDQRNRGYRDYEGRAEAAFCRLLQAHAYSRRLAGGAGWSIG